MKKQTFLEVLKFGLVGVSNTIINQVVYIICINLNMHYLAANIIGFIISVLNAYILQSKLVFKENQSLEKRVWWKVLIKTYAAYAFTGLFLNNVLLILWIDIISIEKYIRPLTELVNKFNIGINNHTIAVDIAPLLNIIVNVPINYLINKFWAYRQNKTR